MQLVLKLLMQTDVYACADLEGGSGGSGPPLDFAKLNFADITENAKKLVIFHICALPQFYVKQNLSAKLVIISFCVCDGIFLT